jgi:hypothetical protein
MHRDTSCGVDEKFLGRILNWAYAYKDRRRVNCSPMFRGYRPERNPEAAPCPLEVVIDVPDAETMNAAWLRLCERDRVILAMWHIHKSAPHLIIARGNKAKDRAYTTLLRPHNLNANVDAAARRWQIVAGMDRGAANETF